MRRTKIVCTVGPASRSPDILKRLISAQVDVFRINFSHGSWPGHRAEIYSIRRLAGSLGRTVAILQDLPGPKIRVGKMNGGSADLVKGSEFSLTTEELLGDSARATVNNSALVRSVKKGDLLHLADGLIRLRVEENLGDSVRCTVVAGGTLSDGKGVNAPGVKMRVEFPTPADRKHIAFGLKVGVDFIALSFIRSAADVRSARRVAGGKGSPQLISKIEKKDAFENFDSILAVSDGVMVARGDLGIEMPSERVPVIQKEITEKCNKAGKPVIVATQMLVSMVSTPVPTRAETTDVATAVLDGADAVMLSDETAVGRYPVDAVRTLDRISRAAEHGFQKYGRTRPEEARSPVEEAIGRAACRLAHYIGAKVIVAPTQTGVDRQAGLKVQAGTANTGPLFVPSSGKADEASMGGRPCACEKGEHHRPALLYGRVCGEVSSTGRPRRQDGDDVGHARSRGKHRPHQGHTDWTQGQPPLKRATVSRRSPSGSGSWTSFSSASPGTPRRASSSSLP
jgi:pyruvate kinase